MNKDIKLGMELSKLQHDYRYDQIVEFLNGESNSCMYYDRLKPLYDEFGYEIVNQTIKELSSSQKKESRPQFKEECETR